ncbi:hypothetical protein Ahy_B05g078950 [Arachis hypogaea]|uniref:Uncharacterized protein n=1 Tax=Arachis hypogaea TaxID=3818 RepID=A0A444Z8M6_ARAHY|nr:hypothetical protein Ahy_B05g078950 [Arachis hypogaea]
MPCLRENLAPIYAFKSGTLSMAFNKAESTNQHCSRSNASPELGRFGLVLVDKGFLDVISRIKFGRLLRRCLRLRFGIVARQNAAVFDLDGPESPLVVHLGPRVLSDSPNQFGVPAHLPRCSLLRRHCCSTPTRACCNKP